MAGILAICGPFFIKLSAQIWFDHTHRFSDGRGCQRFVTAALIVQAGEFHRMMKLDLTQNLEMLYPG